MPPKPSKFAAVAWEQDGSIRFESIHLSRLDIHGETCIGAKVTMDAMAPS